LKVAVQKFGGTSLATAECRSQVVEIINSTKSDGFNVVVVVSAIGRENDPYATDTLINLLKEVNPHPPARELDIIMSCGEVISGVLLANQLSSNGIAAKFLNGEQAGILTDDNYGNAHILYVNPQSILTCLENNIIPVIAGFQGMANNGELTTLGRGGSDTTASAIGAALNAEIIDIFTDVEGIMTADPRIVKNARILDAIGYNEVCQLARDGAKVVHPRAIEIAMQSGIPLRVRSTFSDSLGTLVTHLQQGRGNSSYLIKEQLITGITQMSNISRIKVELSSCEEKKGIDLKVFKSLAIAGISVDFINVQPEAIRFTVSVDNTEKALAVLNKINIYPDIEFNCAKVAVVGAAMTGVPGVMAKVMEALSENDIPILQSGDSYTSIWCLLKDEHMEKAVKALHDKFELGNK